MPMERFACVLLLCGIVHSASYAQHKTISRLQPADSVLIPLKQKGKNLLRAGADSLLSLRKLGLQQTEIGILLKNAANAGESVFEKVKLFDKGKTVQLDKTLLHAGYQYITDTMGTMDLDLQSGARLMEIPFSGSIRGVNGLYTTASQTPPPGKLMQFNFDPAAYQAMIRKKITEKIDPSVVLASTLNRINDIRSGYEQMLQQELAQLQQEFETTYKSKLVLPVNIGDLSNTDMAALRSRLLPDSVLASYEHAREDPTKIADAAKLEWLQKVYAKVIVFKNKFEDNKLVKGLKTHLPFTPSNYQSFLSDPRNLMQILNKHASLGPLQAIFLRISELKLGQNAVESGDFGMKDLINTGASLTVATPKTTMGVIHGRNNNNANNFLQGGLTNMVTNEYSSVTGLKLGTGSGSPLEQMLSVNFFNFSGQDGPASSRSLMQPQYLAAPSSTVATITLHTGYTINGHHLSLDMSRSAGGFQNQLGADSSVSKNNPNAELLGQEGKANYSLLANYNGEIAGVNTRVFFRKVGMGYQNPGNTLLRRGETQAGLGIDRRFLKKKLQLKYATDYRMQYFDPAKKYHHKAFTNKLQAAYRLNSRYKAGFSYQRSDFSSVLATREPMNGSNIRWQLDGGYMLRLSGQKMTGNAVISWQRLEVPLLDSSLYSGRSLTFMHTLSTMLKGAPLSLMVLLNRSDNSDYLFNTSMFSVEADYTWPLQSSLRVGSGLGYYSNEGWNRQLGTRQSLSVTLFGKLNADVEVSWRKAVHRFRDEMADQLFLTAGIQMNF